MSQPVAFASLADASEWRSSSSTDNGRPSTAATATSGATSARVMGGGAVARRPRAPATTLPSFNSAEEVAMEELVRKADTDSEESVRRLALSKELSGLDLALSPAEPPPRRLRSSVQTRGSIVPFSSTNQGQTVMTLSSAEVSDSDDDNPPASARKPKGIPATLQSKMVAVGKKKAKEATYHPKITNVIEDAVLYNRTKALLNNSLYTVFQLVATAVVLVAADLSVAFIHKDADPYFEVLFGLLFLFFLFDLIILSSMDRKQVYSALWWLDLLAAFSIILEMRTVTAWIVEGITSGDQSDGGSVSIVEAGKAARAGTRVGRFMRLIRVVRLVRIMRLLNFLKRWRVRWSCVLRPGEKSVSMERAAARATTALKRQVGAGIRRLSNGLVRSHSATHLRRKSLAGPTTKYSAALPRRRSALGRVVPLSQTMIDRKSRSSRNLDAFRPRRHSGLVADSTDTVEGFNAAATKKVTMHPDVVGGEAADTGVPKDLTTTFNGRRSTLFNTASLMPQPVIKRTRCLPCFVEKLPPAEPKALNTYEPEDDDDREDQSSAIGTVVSARIRQNVIIGIIMIFIIVPLLEVTEVNREWEVNLHTLATLHGSPGQSIALQDFLARNPNTVFLKVEDVVYVDKPDRISDLREIELMRVNDGSSSRLMLDISATRRHQALLSFAQTQVIILLLAWQAVMLNKVMNRLLIRPVERITNHLKPMYAEAIRFLCEPDENGGWNINFGADDGEQLSTKIMLAAIEAMRKKLNDEAKSAFRMRTVLGGLRRLSMEMGGVKPVFQEIRRQSLIQRYANLKRQRSQSVPAAQRARRKSIGVGKGAARMSLQVAPTLGGGAMDSGLGSVAEAAAGLVVDSPPPSPEVPRHVRIAEFQAFTRGLDLSAVPKRPPVSARRPSSTRYPSQPSSGVVPSSGAGAGAGGSNARMNAPPASRNDASFWSPRQQLAPIRSFYRPAIAGELRTMETSSRERSKLRRTLTRHVMSRAGPDTGNSSDGDSLG